MTFEELKQFKKWVAAKTVLNPDNVMAMTLEIPNIQGQMLRKYSDEKQILNKLKNDLAIVYKDAYIKSKFNGDYKLSTKSDIDTFALAEEAYHAAKMACDNQEVVVEYIGKALDGMTRMGYSIKAYVELMKIKHGIVT